MLFKIPRLLIACCVFSTIYSCVDDVDFDQVEDVQFTPEVELDLIYFNLDAQEFFNASTQTSRLTVRDTTNLEFLDSQDIAETITRVDFFFDFNNSIPREFNVDFSFLTENNELQYTTGTSVAQGVNGETVRTIFEETLQGQELLELLASNKVVISVTIPSSNDALTGTLDLQSKARYYLEY